MEKFKIAVWMDKEPSAHNGGAFTYPEALIANIDSYEFDSKLEIVFTGFLKGRKFSKPYLTLENDESYFSRKLTNLVYKLFKWSANFTEKSKQKRKYINFEILKKNGVKLIFYPVNFMQYTDFPFIVNNWDLGQLSTYVFDEFTTTFESRERYFDLVKKALIICADSEAGKQEMINYLNYFPKKIKVLPFFPASFVGPTTSPVKADFVQEGDKYFFYPAAFGAHKNHYGLIMAFHKFLIQYPDIKLIFTGGDYKNKVYFQDLVTDLGIKDSVIFAGFVEKSVLKWLYMHSMGLVMPTYLGPTNMPLLEAQALNCRVACSNLEGHRELLGDYAIYFNPESIEEIHSSLVQLYQLHDQPVVQTKPSKYNIHETMKQLNNIFVESINIRRTWDY
jgi:glycosyltransferase involved in cell wall biosynthesis